MAVAGTVGTVVYMVRNHELRDAGTAPGDPSIIYDPTSLGGCSVLAFDTATGDWLPSESRMSISGTSTNCAGGFHTNGTCLTCEETLVSVGDPGRTDPSITCTKDHGYIFECAGLPGTVTKDGGGTFDQGFTLGGAGFARLEGIWYSNVDGKMYIISTSGGVAGDGQLWIYDDVAKTITMAYETPNPLTLNNPDNVTITPQGAVLFCEDGGSARDLFGNILRHESLMGLANGQIFSFAENNIILDAPLNGVIQPGDYRTREWAGATFDETGQWLFVNIQTPGITFAITGPWANGPF